MLQPGDEVSGRGASGPHFLTSGATHMGKYKVAVIGHTGRGNYGHGIDTVWSHFRDRCDLVAVADADEQGRAEAVKRLSDADAKVSPKPYADYRQMLDEVQPQIV